MVVACLVALGRKVPAAIDVVRAARQGTIRNPLQIVYVKRFKTVWEQRRKVQAQVGDEDAQLSPEEAALWRTWLEEKKKEKEEEEEEEDSSRSLSRAELSGVSEGEEDKGADEKQEEKKEKDDRDRKARREPKEKVGKEEEKKEDKEKEHSGGTGLLKRFGSRKKAVEPHSPAQSLSPNAAERKKVKEGGKEGAKVKEEKDRGKESPSSPAKNAEKDSDTSTSS